MRHLHGILIGILMLISFSAMGQISVVSSYQETDFYTVSIVVQDSVSSDLLPGAFVTITNGTDSLKLISDERGYIYQEIPFKKDSLTISCSLMGYKTCKDKLKLNSYEKQNIQIKLQEDPLQINSIIVTGESVAMVMHGDTTIFNSAAFNTMTGETLGALLKQFPGVEISENELRYQGQSIDRILINGNNMFGKEIANASKMVLADEVKSVKIYEKQAVEDLDNDMNIAKERVMDVQTKKPIEHIGQLALNAKAGIYTNPQSNNRHDWSSGGSLLIGNYSLSSKPRLSFGVSGGKNYMVPDLPYYNFNGYIRTGKDTPGKSGWAQSIDYNFTKENFKSGSTENYISSSDFPWQKRMDESRNNKTNKNQSVSYKGQWFKTKGKDKFRLDGFAQFDHRSSTSNNFRSSDIDNITQLYDKNQADTSNGGTFRIDGSYTRRLSKKGRRFSTSVSLKGKLNTGNGSRIDTNSLSIQPELYTNTLSSKSIGSNITASWEEPINKKSSLTISLQSAYSYHKSYDVWTDMILGKTNFNNSHNFTQNDINANVKLSYRYGKKNDGFYAFASAGIIDALALRNEHFSFPLSSNINFITPVFSGNIAYNKTGNIFELSYSEKEYVPNTTQLRNSINDANPMFLVAGNPSLKLPVDRKLALNYGLAIAEKNINLGINLYGIHHSNHITSKTVFFEKETTLSEYDNQKVMPGSSLSIPVNTNRNFEFSTNVNIDGYVPALKIVWRFNAGWNTGNYSYIIENSVNDNYSNYFICNADISWNGKKANISVNPRIIAELTYTDSKKSYENINPSIASTYEQRFFDFIQTKLNYMWNLQYIPINDQKVSINRLDCELNFLFGKNKQCRIGVFGQDLLNSQKAYSTIVNKYSNILQYQTYLGRSVGINFTYIFSRR